VSAASRHSQLLAQDECGWVCDPFIRPASSGGLWDTCPKEGTGSGDFIRPVSTVPESFESRVDQDAAQEALEACIEGRIIWMSSPPGGGKTVTALFVALCVAGHSGQSSLGQCSALPGLRWLYYAVL
jgi:hypothetical protein